MLKIILTKVRIFMYAKNYFDDIPIKIQYMPKLGILYNHNPWKIFALCCDNFS